MTSQSKNMRMAYSFHVNTQRQIVDIAAQGKSDFDSFANLMHKLVAHERYQSHFAIIADFTKVSDVPSFREIRQFGKLIQTVSNAFGGKVAFVLSDTVQLRAGQFASVIARALRIQMNVFSDRELALAWISNNQESMMESLQQKIIDVITPFQLASLATVQSDGTPWVRYVTIRGDDQMKIRFATPRHSRKVQQIAANSSVHIACGCADVTTASHWVQIRGTAVVRTDDNVRKAFWQDFLHAYFTGPDDEEYVVVEVSPSKIEYFTMASLQPEVLNL